MELFRHFNDKKTIFMKTARTLSKHLTLPQPLPWTPPAADIYMEVQALSTQLKLPEADSAWLLCLVSQLETDTAQDAMSELWNILEDVNDQQTAPDPCSPTQTASTPSPLRLPSPALAWTNEEPEDPTNKTEEDESPNRKHRRTS